MYSLLKKILFLIDPEKAHYMVAFWTNIYYKLPFTKVNFKNQKVNKKGLIFSNKLGLAAGFDKNATMFPWLSKMGFSFIEIGTVTPLAQEGNPKPRLFRLIKDEAVINRMGFNNDGVDKIVERLKNRRKNSIIGGNIGKNKHTPNENAVQDYLICFQKLFDFVDYFVVNVSSPNTPGLRELQEKDSLLKILNTLQEENQKQYKQKPILLKIAPDLNEYQLTEIVQTIQESNIDGIIATNTTISRDNLKTEPNTLEQIGAGGLSGKPLREKSTEIIKFLRQQLGPNALIIGVGGIFSEQDAKEKLNAGADLIQIYTSFIYKGPSLVKKLASV